MGLFRYVVLAFALATPLVVAAQSTSSVGVSALLAELSALEQQISSLTGASTSSIPTTQLPGVSNATSLCPDLSRPLSVGASGADVAELQKFLSQGDFFHAIVTGYFGTVTASAVGQWQVQNGIVPGGDTASTGFGVVGPKTRSAMESLCASSQSSSAKAQCMQTQPPSTECPSNWQPILDQSGCTEYYQCTIPLPSASISTSSTLSGSVSKTSCPVVQQPSCSGTVEPFQTAQNGCVTAYECVL